MLLASRIERPHSYRQEITRLEQGSQVQQDDGRTEEDVEEAQHFVFVAIPLTLGQMSIVEIIGTDVGGQRNAEDGDRPCCSYLSITACFD